MLGWHKTYKELSNDKTNTVFISAANCRQLPGRMCRDAGSPFRLSRKHFKVEAQH